MHSLQCERMPYTAWSPTCCEIARVLLPFSGRTPSPFHRLNHTQPSNHPSEPEEVVFIIVHLNVHCRSFTPDIQKSPPVSGILFEYRNHSSIMTPKHFCGLDVFFLLKKYSQVGYGSLE